MKKLLTTALVLAMLMTMFCVAPAVTAAETPTMTLAIVNVPTEDDTVSATFTGVGSASWVVWSVKADSTDEFIFVGEKRGNKAEAEGFSFTFGSGETALKALVNFTAEAKITYADGTVTTLTQGFDYKTYNQVQAVIRQILGGTKTITEGKAELNYILPAYYDSGVDATVIEALNTTYATQLGFTYNPADPATCIDPQDFYSNLYNEVLKATVNSGNAAAIQNLLDSYYTEVGLAVADQEKIWYDADTEKSAIAAKLATFTYSTVDDFTKQFKTVSFLKKTSSVASTEIIDHLNTYNNRYTNYGTATANLTGGTITNLDFSTYSTLATTATRQEYAKTFMATSYSNLDALQLRWNELLAALPTINEPTVPTPSTPAPGGFGGSSSTSVSVGLEIPIVGEKALPFTDLDDVQWAKEAIAVLYADGVIDGVSAKQFAPNANVTREQFVKIIVNTFGLEGTGKVANFADVDQNAWYAPYINTAVELGIVNGVSDTQFGVGTNISRQDMTVMLYRVANYLGFEIDATSTKSLKDIESIADYAKEAVDKFYKAGIVNGISAGTFGGDLTATRAQAAKICYELREANN